MTLIIQVTAAFLKFSEVLEPMCGENDVLVSHDSVVPSPSSAFSLTVVDPNARFHPEHSIAGGMVN
jgi:hypothetical protein